LQSKNIKNKFFVFMLSLLPFHFLILNAFNYIKSYFKSQIFVIKNIILFLLKIKGSEKEKKMV